MSYTLRPNSTGDTLDDSRDPIRTNFQLIQDRFDENHDNIDGGAGGGKHKFLQMPEQSSEPTTAVDEAAFYSRENDLAAPVTDLYFRREGDGVEILMTGILSGTTSSNLTTSFSTVEILPANSYGFAIFSAVTAAGPPINTPAKMGTCSFFCDATTLYSFGYSGFSGTSASNLMKFQSPSTGDLLGLRAQVDASAVGKYNYRIHYWTIKTP